MTGRAVRSPRVSERATLAGVDFRTLEKELPMTMNDSNSRRIDPDVRAGMDGRNRDTNPMSWIIGVLVVLLLIGAAVWALNGHDDTVSNSSPTTTAQGNRP